MPAAGIAYTTPMAGVGPLAPLVGAAAMIGLALATLFGGLRPAAPPPPEPEPPTPAESMRHALAAFAHWLPRQPDAVRRAIAQPAETLLSAGANLVEALAASAAPERLLAMPAMIAANQAITRDLPDTVAMLDALPASGRSAPKALMPFAGALATIAAASQSAWDQLQSDTITSLEIQEGYLGNKYPDP